MKMINEDESDYLDVKRLIVDDLQIIEFWLSQTLVFLNAQD